MTYSNLVNYTFVSRIETYLFSVLDPPELETLSEYSYFHGNIVICICSIRICSPRMDTKGGKAAGGWEWWCDELGDWD